MISDCRLGNNADSFVARRLEHDDRLFDAGCGQVWRSDDEIRCTFRETRADCSRVFIRFHARAASPAAIRGRGALIPSCERRREAHTAASL